MYSILGVFAAAFGVPAAEAVATSGGVSQMGVLS